MRHFPFLRPLIIAASCIGADAHAQVDVFSLNFTKMTIEHHNTQTAGLPFALDLVHGEQGEISVRSTSTHDITLKRGSFFTADPRPEAWLLFDLRTARVGTGTLVLRVDQSGASVAGGGPQVMVLSGDHAHGTALTMSGVEVLMSDGKVRFMRDAIDVRLSGQPASLFNRPRPGEPLEARLPTPAVGQVIELMLIVADDRGASMRLPVRISRPR